MGGSVDSAIIAKMVQAAERIADALVYKAAPRISEIHHEFPHEIRNTLGRVQHVDEQLAPEIDKIKIGPAAHTDRNTATEHPESGASTQGPVHGPDPNRFEISPEEAQEKYEQVRDREPDFAGSGNRVNLVDTSAGSAVVRFKKEQPSVTFLKKWMSENTAIEYARECAGVRTPKILYAGVDPATGREFTIMQYVPGRTPDFGDPEVMNWLPDLLDQVQSMSSHPVPAGMELDIPRWQRQMIQDADNEYHNLPPDQLSRLRQLGIGPLSDYVRPDLSRAGEPVVFAHNDLYPLNLRIDEQGKVWILDWEHAGPGDPLHDASRFLERLWGMDEETRARATAMWIERVSPVNSAVDTEAALNMYRTVAHWRGTVMGAEELPRSVAADPSCFEGWVDLYHERFSRNSDFPNLSRDELRALLLRWTE